MKVAFVGKGGSGKSTVCSQFIKSLIENNQNVLAIDADINMHLASLLHVDHPKSKALSDSENSSKIREILKKDNQRIQSIKHFMKSTPPARGSHLLKVSSQDPIIKDFSTNISKNSFLMHVGTYEQEGIGVSCYHTHLVILENLLSHSYAPKDWIVCDMVAGTDAFSNTLHLQFDFLIFIVEPTIESVTVFNKYFALAKEAGVQGQIIPIGNKIEDEEDVEYINKNISKELTFWVPYSKTLKRMRREGTNIQPEEFSKAFKELREFIEKNKISEQDRLTALHKMHKKCSKLAYIIARMGDVSNQIDEEFNYQDEN